MCVPNVRVKANAKTLIADTSQVLSISVLEVRVLHWLGTCQVGLVGLSGGLRIDLSSLHFLRIKCHSLSFFFFNVNSGDGIQILMENTLPTEPAL